MATTLRSNNTHTVGSYMNMISNEPRLIQEAILIQLMRQLSKPSVEQHPDNKDYTTSVMQLCGAWNDDARSTQQIKDEIRSARVSGETRHINDWPM